MAKTSLSIAIRGFYNQCRSRLGDALDEMAMLLGCDDTLEAAVARFFPAQPVPERQQIFHHLADWVRTEPERRSFLQYLNLLRLAREVLCFECDRPFYQTNEWGGVDKAAWYFDAPTLDFAESMYDIPAALRGELCRTMVRYLNGLPSECRKAAPRPPQT